jgi:D-alanyl-D-alanine dipeptidase
MLTARPIARMTLACCIALASFAATAPRAAAQTLPSPLVYLRDVDASILQDMRYAAVDNFTGRRVPGYNAAECVLVRSAAEALARVQKDLAARKLSLKVYDCYRPLRAVRAFVAWAARRDNDQSTKRFHPRLARSQLIPQGYIASQSGHSRGHTIDLTLVALPEPKTPPFDPKADYGPCTGPAEGRAPDSSVDMGTGFDCFDARSHTGSSGLSAEQARARRTLVEAMSRHGFDNYRREWWHFTYAPAQGGQAYDVPIGPRPSGR